MVVNVICLCVCVCVGACTHTLTEVWTVFWFLALTNRLCAPVSRKACRRVYYFYYYYFKSCMRQECTGAVGFDLDVSHVELPCGCEG